MNILSLSLIAYGASIALSLSPINPAHAQDTVAPADAAASAPAAHGDWTLKEREDWLSDRLDKSRDTRSLDRVEYDHARHELDDLQREEHHIRDHAHGQLTDNQTADLEARLDDMAAKIHWANMAAYSRPW